MKIPLLPNNVGKKSVNDAGPKQGHDKVKMLTKIKKTRIGPVTGMQSIHLLVVIHNRLDLVALF